jgi:NADH:quinone reductase (non-electrogenic)
VLGSRSTPDTLPLDFPTRLDHHHRAAQDPCERDLGKRAPGASDRDYGVTRRHHRQIPGVADTGHDDVVDPLVRVRPRLAGEDADRDAARRLRPARRRLHHLVAAAAHKGRSTLRKQAPDRLCAPLVLDPAPDHGDLRAGHRAMVEDGMTERQARGGILVLGGGFAGAWLSRLLGKRGRESTIVNHENFMLFASLLPEAASGSLEPRHVVVPLRMMCPRADVLVGKAASLDTARQAVDVETEHERIAIRYEQLVIALGAVARTLSIPGLEEHALGFKDLADAIQLRNHVLRRLEAATSTVQDERRRQELTFVFVGGGYAGVEALAELSDLVRDAMRHYPALRGEPQRWILVDAAPTILPEIPTRLGEYAAAQLSKRGVEIRVSTTLERLDSEGATLSDGDRIPTRTLVWTAGVRARPILSTLGLEVDERGRLRVDSTFRVEGQSNVFALGDGASVPNLATPDHPDPPTSQHALRQARRLAKNLTGKPEPYRYRMLGQVATLGRYKGIADVFGLRIRGFPGWFITRTYHLYQLPLVSRKLRVVTDWTVALLFRRDIAELSMLGHAKPVGHD